MNGFFNNLMRVAALRALVVIGRDETEGRLGEAPDLGRPVGRGLERPAGQLGVVRVGQGELGVAADRREQVVRLVGQPRGQGPQRAQPVRPRELVLQGIQFMLKRPDLRQLRLRLWGCAQIPPALRCLVGSER